MIEEILALAIILIALSHPSRCAPMEEGSTVAHASAQVSDSVVIPEKDILTFSSAEPLPDGAAAFAAWKAINTEPAAGGQP